MTRVYGRAGAIRRHGDPAAGYPRTQLEMDEQQRSQKRTKFGSTEYVYPKGVMGELRGWFEEQLAARLPQCRVLYWT